MEGRKPVWKDVAVIQGGEQGGAEQGKVALEFWACGCEDGASKLCCLLFSYCAYLVTVSGTFTETI